MALGAALAQTAPARAADTTTADAAATAAPAPVAADEAPTNDEIIVTAQQARKQVVSDGSIGVLGSKDALSTPFNVTTYTAQLILDQQAGTIGEVMENDPAVRTTYGSGNQSELFVIRGFPTFGDDVSIDGLFGVTPRQLVSPELYDGVQVLNGSSAFLYGAAPGGSGIGGSINLTPKRATRTLFRVTANYASDSIFGGNFDFGGRFGDDKKAGLRINGVYRDGNTAIDHEHRKVAAAGIDFDLRAGPGHFYFDFGHEYQEADWTRPEVRLAANIGVPKTPGASYNYGQPWTFTKLTDTYAIGRVEIELFKDAMLYIAGGARQGHEAGDYSTITLTNSTTGAGTGGRLYVPRRDHNEAGQIGLRGKFETGPLTHEFNVGAAVNFQENRNAFTFGSFPPPYAASATSYFTNIYNTPTVPKPTNSTLPSSGGSLTDLPRVSTNEFSSEYLSDTIGIADGLFETTLGVRHQNLLVNAYNRGSGLRTSQYDKSADTPVIGVIVRPSQNFSFYANRMEALLQGPTAPLNANTVNSGEIFAPFVATQYEVGGKVAIRGLTGTLAVYQTKQPSAFNVPVPGSPTLVRFSVDGEQRNRGLELTLNGEPAKWIRLIGGVSLNDAKLIKTANGTNNGHKAVGVPDYQVNLGAEVVPSFLRNATLTARVVATGKQMVDIANTQQIPAWTRLDLGIRYVVVVDQHPVTLRLSAENVTNNSFWYSSFGGYLVQGEPRSVKASVTFEY